VLWPGDLVIRGTFPFVIIAVGLWALAWAERSRALAVIAEAQRAEFGYLREALGLTPGNLSRHLTVLEEAGLVTVEKGYAGRRPRTWVRITRQGRAALAAELAALAELLRRHNKVPAPPEGGPPADPGA
jgi:DNA-binding transcriptional ArsR family regulator